MILAEVPLKLGAIFAPIADTDPDVHVEFVDALDPPCRMIVWDEPWLDAVQACNAMAYPVVTCVAGRVEPGPGLSVLTELVSDTLRKLRVDSNAWGIRATSGPRVFEIGGVSYLAARVGLRVAVTF